MAPLTNRRVVCLAVYLPAVQAAARLHEFGAEVIFVEPPEGSSFQRWFPGWYDALHEGQETVRLNAKDPGDRGRLEELLSTADVLITSMRPAALERLGLSWKELHARHPQVCLVAIIGYPAPHEDRPGHDLNYVAKAGLVRPPAMPLTLLADVAGAERAAMAALALLLARERGQGAGEMRVSLAASLDPFSSALRYGATAPGGRLGGGKPEYALYKTRDGWIALGALESHFWKSLLRELGASGADYESLARAFLTQAAEHWEQWAVERSLPIVAVKAAEKSAWKHVAGKAKRKRLTTEAQRTRRRTDQKGQG